MKAGKTISDTGIWVSTEAQAFKVNQPTGGNYILVGEISQISFQSLSSLASVPTVTDVKYCAITVYRDLSDISTNGTVLPAWSLSASLFSGITPWQTSASVPLYATVPLKFESAQYDRFSMYQLKIACRNSSNSEGGTVYVGLSEPFKLYDPVGYGPWNWADYLNPPKTSTPAAAASPSSPPATGPVAGAASVTQKSSSTAITGQPPSSGAVSSPASTTEDVSTGSNVKASSGRKATQTGYFALALTILVLGMLQ
ncbi:hypothetical protein HDU93_000623 [Gonapodya sp. JEL0774]|nr:hypothetical protein HDU93_000623 [Gonapodya sp. JEL0774]